MNKLFLSLSLLWFVAAPSSAQQSITAEAKVPLTPAVCVETGLHPEVLRSLENKLLKVVSDNGFGSWSEEFVLTADVVVNNRSMTATAPVKTLVDAELTLYIVGVTERIIISQLSLPVRGIADTEVLAVKQAVNRFNPRSPQVRAFTQGAREKIVDYYSSRVPVLIAKAQSLSDRGEYDEALAVLNAIPECVDEYATVQPLLTELYVKWLDREALEIMEQAKVETVKHNYEDAMDLLLDVDPASNHAKKASEMIRSIASQLAADEAAAMAEQLARAEQQREDMQRAQDNAIMLEKMRIEAAAKYHAEQAVSTEQKVDMAMQVGSWLFGSLKKK